MKSLVLLLAALAVVTTAVSPEHHEPGHTDVVRNLLERTGKLTHHLYEFESKLDARVDPARIIRAGSLQARVEALEEPSCPKHSHQCGGDDPQCISDLFVCDGHNDCRNGEDEKHCTNPLKAGDRFVGDVVFDDCTKRRPEHITLFVESVTTAAFFTAVPELHVHLEMKSDTHTEEGDFSLPADAIYSFGEHKVVVYPPEDDDLGLIGQFDGHNYDRFVGDIVHSLSHTVCAKYIFHRH